MALCHFRITAGEKRGGEAPADGFNYLRQLSRKKDNFMNLLSLYGGAVFLLVPLTCISSLRADSIDRNGGEDYAAIVSKLELDGHSGSPAADYSFFQDGPYFGD